VITLLTPEYYDDYIIELPIVILLITIDINYNNNTINNYWY